jgi:hypothetical protein
MIRYGIESFKDTDIFLVLSLVNIYNNKQNTLANMKYKTFFSFLSEENQANVLGIITSYENSVLDTEDILDFVKYVKMQKDSCAFKCIVNELDYLRKECIKNSNNAARIDPKLGFVVKCYYRDDDYGNSYGALNDSIVAPIAQAGISFIDLINDPIIYKIANRLRLMKNITYKDLQMYVEDSIKNEAATKYVYSVFVTIMVKFILSAPTDNLAALDWSYIFSKIVTFSEREEDFTTCYLNF